MNQVVDSIPFQREVEVPRPVVNGFLSQYFIVILVGAYVIAAFFPGFGNWIRSISLGAVGDSENGLSMSLIMLAFLLFNAGLGMGNEHFATLIARPGIILAGLGAAFLIPFVSILLLIFAAAIWPHAGVTNILIGLTLVAVMPIANSSAAWSHNAYANMAVSLSLVCFSTLLAPITAPLILSAFGGFLSPGHQNVIHHLAASVGGSFVFLWVIAPTALGIIIRYFLGTDRIKAAVPYIRSASAINLLLLNYCHASAFLPKVLAEYEFSLLAMTLVAALIFCIGSASIGWIAGRFLNTDLPERTALMFGVGMKNNGVALVLASLFMADNPGISLTIVFCTFGQHLVASAALSAVNSVRKVKTRSAVLNRS